MRSGATPHDSTPSQPIQQLYPQPSAAQIQPSAQPSSPAMPPTTRSRARSAATSSSSESSEVAQPRQPLPSEVFVLVSVDTTKAAGAAWVQAWKADNGLQVARHALNRLLNGEFPLVHSSHEIDEVTLSCQEQLDHQPRSREAVLRSHAERLLVLLHNADDLKGGGEGVTFSLVQVEDLTTSSVSTSAP